MAGRTLRQVLTEEERLPWRQAVEIARSLLDALRFLHARDIIHRDLQPSNILITPCGTTRLVDLGAARRWRPDAILDTVPLGTPGFAAPEQYGRAQTDARADLYSVGALLHFMLTGRDPADSVPWQFEPPHRIVSDVPSQLGDLVMQSLEIDAALRPPTAEHMAASLDAIISDGPGISSEFVCLRFPEAIPYFFRSHQLTRALVAPSLGMLAFSAAVWPIPLAVGAGLGMMTTLPAHLAWRRWRNTTAEIDAERLRLFVHHEWWTARWQDIDWLRLTVDVPSNRLLRAQFSADRRSVEIDADWPGLSRLVEEVMARAPLEEKADDVWSASYVGTRVRSFGRRADAQP